MYPEAVFDVVADDYDNKFTDSIIGRLQRNKVWDYLGSCLPENSSINILELNCGTGTDALWLAAKGHKVWACDISSRMIDISKSKHINPNLEIHFDACSFDNIASHYQGMQFDLIFSNFGGLNCIDESAMRKLHLSLQKLLKPDGNLIMVLMAKYCMLERLYFITKLKYLRNRRGSFVSATLADGSVQQTWYYSSTSLRRIFENFKLRAKKPVGLFIPPSYFENNLKKKRGLMGMLGALENAFGNIEMFANYGDHILLHFENGK